MNNTMSVLKMLFGIAIIFLSVMLAIIKAGVLALPIGIGGFAYCAYVLASASKKNKGAAAKRAVKSEEDEKEAE